MSAKMQALCYAIFVIALVSCGTAEPRAPLATSSPSRATPIATCPTTADGQLPHETPLPSPGDGAGPRFLRVPTCAEWPATRLAFDQSGQRLAVGTARELFLLETDAGATLWRRVFPDAGIKSLDFSPDGGLIAAGLADGRVWLGRTSDGQEVQGLAPTGPRHSDGSGAIRVVAFAPVGNLLAAGGEDGVVQLWEIGSGRAVGTPLAHRFPVADLAFTPDGRDLLSADAGGQTNGTVNGQAVHLLAPLTVRRWHVGDGIALGPIDTAGQFARFVRLSRDAGQLVVVDGANRVQSWDIIEDTLRPRQERYLPTFDVFDVEIAHDGQLLLAGGHHGTIQYWRLGVPTQAPIVVQAGTTAVYALDSSSAGQLIAAASEDGIVRMWGLADVAAR